MQEKPLSRINKNESRIYLILDKPEDSCIMNYNWSNTEVEWVFDKMVRNVWDETLIGNSLREGKYYIGVF